MHHIDMHTQNIQGNLCGWYIDLHSVVVETVIEFAWLCKTQLAYKVQQTVWWVYALNGTVSVSTCTGISTVTVNKWWELSNSGTPYTAT